jgi:hypothetical protein
VYILASPLTHAKNLVFEPFDQIDDAEEAHAPIRLRGKLDPERLRYENQAGSGRAATITVAAFWK